MGEERRRVSLSQLEKLCELLETRRDLALGNNKTNRSREIHPKIWQEVADVLNQYRDGTKKNWKGWCKFWADYKCRLKKLAARERKKVQESESSDIHCTFSNTDIRFLDMIGEYDCKSGLWKNQMGSVKVENNDTTSHLHSNNSNSDSSESMTEHTTYAEPGPSQKLKPEPPPRMIRRSPRISQSMSLSPPASPKPHRNITEHVPSFRVLAYPQRIANVKAEPQMTAEQALIAESQKQTRIQEKKLELFSMLVSELREIKEILRERCNGNNEDTI